MKMTEGVLGRMCLHSTHSENRFPGMLTSATSEYTTGSTTAMAGSRSIRMVALSGRVRFMSILGPGGGAGGGRKGGGSPGPADPVECA